MEQTLVMLAKEYFQQLGPGGVIVHILVFLSLVGGAVILAVRSRSGEPTVDYTGGMGALSGAPVTTSVHGDEDEEDLVISVQICGPTGSSFRTISDVVSVDEEGEFVVLTHDDGGETIIRLAPDCHLIASGKHGDATPHTSKEESTRLTAYHGNTEVLSITLFDSNLWEQEWQGGLIEGEEQDGTSVVLLLGGDLTLVFA